jgi:hypothetical protein
MMFDAGKAAAGVSSFGLRVIDDMKMSRPDARLERVPDRAHFCPVLPVGDGCQERSTVLENARSSRQLGIMSDAGSCPGRVAMRES